MVLPEHAVQHMAKAKAASKSCIGRHPSVSLATALLLRSFRRIVGSEEKLNEHSWFIDFTTRRTGRRNPRPAASPRAAGGTARKSIADSRGSRTPPSGSRRKRRRLV